MRRRQRSCSGDDNRRRNRRRQLPHHLDHHLVLCKIQGLLSGPSCGWVQVMCLFARSRLVSRRRSRSPLATLDPPRFARPRTTTQVKPAGLFGYGGRGSTSLCRAKRKGGPRELGGELENNRVADFEFAPIGRDGATRARRVSVDARVAPNSTFTSHLRYHHFPRRSQPRTTCKGHTLSSVER